MKEQTSRLYSLIRGSIILILLSFVFAFQAKTKSPLISNVTGGQFTVSWTTKSPCAGKVTLYKDNERMGDFYDDRGKDYKGIIHHITIKDLKEETVYAFSVESDKSMDDNEGELYQITTGPNLIPVGSIQPAGKVFLADGITPAVGAVVYIHVIGGTGNSGMLSTVVDENGYWFIELVNAREADFQKLYLISEGESRLSVSALGQTGVACLEAPALDSQGGKRLYDPLILK